MPMVFPQMNTRDINMPRAWPAPLRTAGLLAWLGCVLPAHAAEFPPELPQDGPGVHAIVQLQHTCSSNLFGLRSAAIAQGLFGDGQLSDCWTTAQGGVRFDNEGAVSRLHGHVLLDRTQYSHYRMLDSTGHDVLLAYNLDHAPLWSAYVSASDRAAQQDLTILQTPLNDLLRKQVLTAGGARRIAGPFELTADTAWIRIRNGAASQRPYDMDISLLRLGPRYVSAAGNTIGYVLSFLEGRYPNAAEQTGNAPLAEFHQIENAATFSWSDAAYWQIAGTAGYLRYTAPQLPALDFGGGVADVLAKLTLTDKTAVALSLYRKLAAYNTTTTNYEVVTGAQLRGIWSVDADVRLVADYTRDDARFPGSARRDTVRGGAFSATYLPRPGTQLALRYARTNRDSSVADASYDSHILSLSLQQAF